MKTIVVALSFTLAVALVACSAPESDDSAGIPADTGPPPRATELGTGDHTPGSVVLKEIAGPAAKLNGPRDLAFNPLRPDDLWVVNLADNSVVIVHDASADARTTERRLDADARHFMYKPSSLAFGGDETTFGKPGTLSICGESRNELGGAGNRDFMGPALWSSDLTIFAIKDPFGLGSHLDMLHNTPLCMGSAHENANIHWNFGGLANAIYKNDFKRDHGIGQDDHNDGESFEYVRGEVSYVAGVPSHLVFRAEDKMLYIADTGNGRIAKLDTTSGTRGVRLPVKEPQKVHYRIDGAVLSDVVAASTGLLQQPSGIEIQGEYLYVSDNKTGTISAFTFEGERVNWLDTGLGEGTLSGLAFGPDKKLYFVDMRGNRVLRIDPPPP